MDTVSSEAAWAPPLRFQDSGYRCPDKEAQPSAQERAALESKTLQYLQSLRGIEQSSSSHEPVVKKVSRQVSYEQVLGLHQIIQSMFPALENGLLAFKPTSQQEKSDLRTLPCLTVTSDAGADAQSCLQFLQYHLGLRMLTFWEPRHKLARCLENSQNKSNLRSALHIAEMILNFSRGPWVNHRWFRILQEECVDYLKCCSANLAGL